MGKSIYHLVVLIFHIIHNNLDEHEADCEEEIPSADKEGSC
jgi:hypothetical protein